MKLLLRMLRLTAAYPRAFTVFVASGLLTGALTGAFLGLMRLILMLLESSGADGRAAAPIDPAKFDWPVVGGTLKRLAEWYAATPPRDLFVGLLAVGIALFLVRCALEYTRRYLEGWLRGRLVRDTQTRLARHLLSLDYAFFQAGRQGEIVSRLTNDLGMLGQCVRLSCELVTKPVVFLSALAFVLAVDWRLSLIVLVVLPAGVVALAHVARRIRRASRRAQERTANLTEIMMQFLSGMRIVKAFACEDFEAGQFARENDRLLRAHMSRVRARAGERLVNEFMTSFAALAVLALGGWWVFAGELDIATLMAFYLALGVMASPVREMGQLYADLQEAGVGASRVFELFDRRPTLLPGPRDDLPADATVRFEDVHFAYHADAPVLRGLDLELPAGKTVALIGRTGAGKSTVADLLLRLRDPQSGRITLGGVPLGDFTFGALRGGIALVNQDSFLFNSTLRDNIAYGSADAGDGVRAARVEAAARAAQIHDEIMAFPDGYDTVVGERGANLSGGQRQRIAIARALYKDAPILILDEATSSLDASSERRVQEALAALMAGRTCLVIAHRLSTVRRADAIACLEDGRVAAVGSHEQMLGLSPVYARFVALQSAD